MIVDVDAAAQRLRRGEVVAYPTETVFGLGADARREEALARLCALKGRERGRGLSVLVRDAAALEELAPGLPARARALARRHWPGPLTLVVHTAHPALAGVSTPRGVGFRCSSHPVARALVEAAGAPVVSTSCNRSGEPPCTTAEEVERVFGAGLPIAGGAPAGGLAPSTVVAVDDAGALEVLREGALPLERILAEIPA